MKNHQEGYIALVSAIIISILLISITITIGMNNFFARFNVLDSESKERSSALAEACVDAVILNLANNSNYNPNNECVSVGDSCPSGTNICAIVSVKKDHPSIGETTIKTKAIFNKSHSNFKVVIMNTRGSKTVLWQECPYFTSSDSSC